jgi:hypothetical protein
MRACPTAEELDRGSLMYNGAFRGMTVKVYYMCVDIYSVRLFIDCSKSLVHRRLLEDNVLYIVCVYL